MATINLNKIPADNQQLCLSALQALADNLSADNILFLGTLAKKTDINKKLSANKTLIKNYL